jgi:hypothetical protein
LELLVRKNESDERIEAKMQRLEQLGHGWSN